MLLRVTEAREEFPVLAECHVAHRATGVIVPNHPAMGPRRSRRREDGEERKENRETQRGHASRRSMRSSEHRRQPSFAVNSAFTSPPGFTVTPR